MIKIDAEWLHAPETQRVCAALNSAGYDAYFVGGCVRNALISAPASDIDIATNALPEQVMTLAKDAGIKALPTGIDHGTVTLILGGEPFEITTYRKDVETDGRRAIVAFATSIEEDARRRDFTMNALYADAAGTVFDPLDGLPDLRARRVRFIENPETRIREDYLRILRFFRFHAWYGDPGGGLDQEGLAACAAQQEGLAQISAERITSEILKTLSAPDPAPAIAAMAQTGVLETVLPGADATALPILVHLEQSNNSTPDAQRRLGLMGGHTDLRLSKVQSRRLKLLRNELGLPTSPSELGYRYGLDVAKDVLLARCAMFETLVNADDLAKISIGANARFPIRAADIADTFSGPALGQQLRDLESRWIASGFQLTKAQLLS